MARTLEIAVPLVLLLAGAALFATTFGNQFDVPTFGGDIGPAAVPRMFLVAWMMLALIVLVSAVRAPAPVSMDIDGRQLASAMAVVVATGYAMTEIGFVLATIPGFALFCWVFRFRRLVTLAVVSLAAPLAIWALFTFGFELLLPRSPWFHLL